MFFSTYLQVVELIPLYKISRCYCALRTLSSSHSKGTILPKSIDSKRRQHTVENKLRTYMRRMFKEAEIDTYLTNQSWQVCVRTSGMRGLIINRYLPDLAIDQKHYGVSKVWSNLWNTTTATRYNLRNLNKPLHLTPSGKKFLSSSIIVRPDQKSELKNVCGHPPSLIGTPPIQIDLAALFESMKKVGGGNITINSDSSIRIDI